MGSVSKKRSEKIHPVPHRKMRAGISWQNSGNRGGGRLAQRGTFKVAQGGGSDYDRHFTKAAEGTRTESFRSPESEPGKDHADTRRLSSTGFPRQLFRLRRLLRGFGARSECDPGIAGSEAGFETERTIRGNSRAGPATGEVSQPES